MPLMQTSDLTPRQYWAEVKSNPNRAKFGFGEKAALINIDLQRAYTDIDRFPTAYQTDPRQIEYVNRLAALARRKNMPVIWTFVAYMDNADDAGVWGTRTNTEHSLQNIKENSERAQLDPRRPPPASGEGGGDRSRWSSARRRTDFALSNVARFRQSLNPSQSYATCSSDRTTLPVPVRAR